MLAMYSDSNIKCLEYLYRRVDIQDAVDAHLLAAIKCDDIGFDKFIISATTLFEKEDVSLLGGSADFALTTRCPQYSVIFEMLQWKMFKKFDRSKYC